MYWYDMSEDSSIVTECADPALAGVANASSLIRDPTQEHPNASVMAELLSHEAIF